jgi:PAS domain S-box-containing protein
MKAVLVCALLFISAACATAQAQPTQAGVLAVDEQQRVVVFNYAAEKMFVCTASDALGSSLDRFIPARFRDLHHDHIRTFGITGVTTRSMYSPGVLTGLRSTGEEFPIEATISQVEAAGQKLYTVVLRDITERERAEKALREARVALADPTYEETLAFLCDLRAVPTLVHSLAGKDAGARRRVVAGWGELAPASVPPLLDLLKRSDSKVRFWAAEALGRIGASERFHEMLRSVSAEVRLDGDLFADRQFAIMERGQPSPHVPASSRHHDLSASLNWDRSASRARVSRDFTVPTATPRENAISS